MKRFILSPGTLTLSAAGITYIADRSSYQGYFVSSSDELNKIWADSAYTAQIDSVPAGSLPGNWTIANGVMDAAGGDVGLLNQGSTWSGYTDTFGVNIVSNQAGWVVRGQDPGDGYVFILNDHTDTAGTPDTLQELDLHGGTYTSVGSVTLPAQRPLPFTADTGYSQRVSPYASGYELDARLRLPHQPLARVGEHAGLGPAGIRARHPARHPRLRDVAGPAGSRRPDLGRGPGSHAARRRGCLVGGRERCPPVQHERDRAFRH